MSFRLRYAELISKVALAGLCTSSWVRAEPTAADKALAVTLFRDGKSLMDAGRLPEACGKLEESQRLDPGGGTLLNVALCHERQGRTATAWAEFVEALGVARRDHRDGRITFAQEHITALEGNLATITLVVSAEADDPDLELRRDGAVVGRAAWGAAIPVDPGDHTIEAGAPNRKPWRSVVSVGAEGQPRGLSVPVPVLEQGGPPALAAGQVPASPGAAPAPSSFASTAGAGPSDARVESGSTQRTWGFVALGVGALGIGAGTVFGLTALGKKSDSDDECHSDLCTARGVELNHDAGKFADFATVGFAVGVSGAILGTVLIVTASPSENRAAATHPSLALAPILGPGTVGLGGAGRF